MTTKTIFETCRPRADVLRGTVAEADFAADLAQVVTGVGSPEYVDPVRFFANSYPTRGLKNLLANVCRRLSGAGGEAAAIFRLDTSYGGGKTHALIALAHAARGVPRVAGMDEFIDSALLPRGAVRLAAFDGENADPANGRTMGEGVRAHTPWGELAYALAGKSGYDRVRNSDAGGVAPGADTLRELFGGQPTLILLDELSVYLRKVQQLGAGVSRSVLQDLGVQRIARKPVGQFVSELLRGALHARGGGTTAVRPRERYGFRPIPAGGAVVTNEVVNEIRDGLGV